MSDCWFEKGLKFGCTGCGDCCRGPGGYVWVNETEIGRLAASLKLTLDEFGRRYLRRTWNGLAFVDAPSGDCVFLGKDGRCTVYALRPSQCRTFPWWPEVLRDEQAWEGEKRNCPGLGQGRHYSLEEIRRSMKSSE